MSDARLNANPRRGFSNSPGEHPSTDLLGRWARDALAESDNAVVESHLEQCPECAERLERIDAGDHDFAHRLRCWVAGTRFQPAGNGSRRGTRVAGPTGADTVFEPRRGAAGDDAAETQPVGCWQPGRYVLGAELGSGGIGRVRVAHDRRLGRDVAIKELLPGKAVSARHRQRFTREATITAQLNHPGTPFVIDYWTDSREPCYAMNLVRGQMLAEQIRGYHASRRAGSAPFAEFVNLLNVFVAVCNTVAYAHDSGIVHRDLKSDNVMTGQFGQVTLLDWGLAKRVGEEDVSLGNSISHGPNSSRTTLEGQTVGTPAFMAPEQARGEVRRIDKATDTYSLCGMLYEILAGRPPFQGDDVGDVMRSVSEDTPPDPAQFNIDAPRSLVELCLRGLSKDKRDRIASAASIAQRVTDWIARRADRALAEQHRQRFFDLSFDAMAIISREGGLCVVNAAWERLFGWRPEQILGLTRAEMVHPDDQAKVEEVHDESEAGRANLEVEIRMLCADGSYKWTQWNATPYGEEGLTFVVGRDIDAFKSDERFLKQVLDSIPDALVVVDPDGRIRAVNATTEAMFGYDRERLLGSDCSMLIPDAGEAIAKAPPADAPPGDGADHSEPRSGRVYRGKHRDGSEFPVRMRGGPAVTDDGVLISRLIRPVEDGAAAGVSGQAGEARR